MTDHLPAKQLGKYHVSKTLGKGRLKVKLVYDPATKVQYAAKICKSKLKASSLEHEANILRELNTLGLLNIVKIVDYVENTDLSFRKVDFQDPQAQKPVREYRFKAAIIMELAPNDSLFDYIFELGSFEVDLSRHFFISLVESVNSLHRNGYCHLDIKPDNILFDEEFGLKLCDFGFAKKFIDPEKNKFTSKLGSEWYMAPEIHIEDEYSGVKADIFACGIVLFILNFGKPPFFKAEHKDPFYKYFVNDNPNGFWDLFEEKVSKGAKCDPRLKELLSAIFSFKPINRPGWDEIREFDWVKRGPLEKDDLISQMNVKRNELISKKNRCK